MAATAAQALPGFTTGNVNMRAGPDTAFPRVTVLPRGVPVEIAGCLDNQSWCDVAYGPYRGWVYGEYLAFSYQGRRVLVPEYAPVIGLPVIGFNFGNYWGRYYRGAPWWGERGRWQYYAPRPRPGWGPPPPGPGPRPPGWWRPGQRPPSGPVGPGPRPPGWQGGPPQGWQGGRPPNAPPSHARPPQAAQPPGQPPNWQGRPPRGPGGPPQAQTSGAPPPDVQRARQKQGYPRNCTPQAPCPPPR